MIETKERFVKITRNKKTTELGLYKKGAQAKTFKITNKKSKVANQKSNANDGDMNTTVMQRHSTLEHIQSKVDEGKIYLLEDKTEHL
jgi:hypothetical protein